MSAEFIALRTILTTTIQGGIIAAVITDRGEMG